MPLKYKKINWHGGPHLSPMLRSECDLNSASLWMVHWSWASLPSDLLFSLLCLYSMHQRLIWQPQLSPRSPHSWILASFSQWKVLGRVQRETEGSSQDISSPTSSNKFLEAAVLLAGPLLWTSLHTHTVSSSQECWSSVFRNVTYSLRPSSLVVGASLILFSHLPHCLIFLSVSITHITTSLH